MGPVRGGAAVALISSLGIAGAGTAALALAGERAGLAGFAGWTLAGGGLTAILTVVAGDLLRSPDGARLRSVGLPNALTLIRLVLVAPTLVLFAGGRPGAAAVLYVLLGLTDVADGVVARTRGPASAFGVIVDPVADVVSTFALYTAFRLHGLVPVWLYAILVVRYGMLFAGSLILWLAVGPIEFRATIPGKVVGVVQAVGALVILRGFAQGGLGEPVRSVLFAFLGLGFASIVASQARIGWRHIRRGSPARTSGIGSSR